MPFAFTADGDMHVLFPTILHTLSCTYAKGILELIKDTYHMHVILPTFSTYLALTQVLSHLFTILAGIPFISSKSIG